MCEGSLAKPRSRE